MAPTQRTEEETFELITRNLQEVIGEAIIRRGLQEGRTLKCYWGTATTGRPHIAYFVPLTKIADFLNAGVEVTILLADVHAVLDNLKAPIELVQHRVAYYRYLLISIFKSLGVPVNQLKFIVGSSYQLTEKFNLDNLRLCALVSSRDAKRAGSEVVKQVESPLLSGLLYPGLQVLDEEYLDCDFQFGGADQRKIFVLAEEILPKLGYRKRAHLMNRMVSGLEGGKMSSSDPNSKIDFLDTPDDIKIKIQAALCEPGNIANNGILAFAKAVIFPISHLRIQMAASGLADDEGIKPFVLDGAPEGTVVSIRRNDVLGGPLHYNGYDEMEHDFAKQQLLPSDLKAAVQEALINILAPIHRMFQESTEFREAERKAYPPTDLQVVIEKGSSGYEMEMGQTSLELGRTEHSLAEEMEKGETENDEMEKLLENEGTAELALEEPVVGLVAEEERAELASELDAAELVLEVGTVELVPEVGMVEGVSEEGTTGLTPHMETVELVPEVRTAELVPEVSTAEPVPDVGMADICSEHIVEFVPEDGMAMLSLGVLMQAQAISSGEL